jgi:hypothetical protein
VRSPFHVSLAALAAAAAIAAGMPAVAGSIQIDYPGPSLDRWHYAFNGTPGFREVASSFGNVRDNPFYADFDNRDGQLIVGFDTVADIPPGLGTGSYDVLSAVLTVTCQCDVELLYDETQDPYQVYLPSGDPEAVDSDDPGAPFELFGTGYRNGLNVFAYQEDTPYAFGSPVGLSVRNAYALGYGDGGATGTAIDVSNSVRERFDPAPWAIGQIADLAPGDVIPSDSDVTFTIDVDAPEIQQYLRQALNDGRLRLTVTSLHDVGEMSSVVPNFYTKENPLVEAGIVSAARLSLEVAIGNPADVNGDGVVNVDDLVAVILAWGPCPEPPAECQEDIDGSGAVDVDDLVAVILNWTT